MQQNFLRQTAVTIQVQHTAGSLAKNLHTLVVGQLVVQRNIGLVQHFRQTAGNSAVNRIGLGVVGQVSQCRLNIVFFQGCDLCFGKVRAFNLNATSFSGLLVKPTSFFHIQLVLAQVCLSIAFIFLPYCSSFTAFWRTCAFFPWGTVDLAGFLNTAFALDFLNASAQGLLEVGDLFFQCGFVLRCFFAKLQSLFLQHLERIVLVRNRCGVAFAVLFSLRFDAALDFFDKLCVTWVFTAKFCGHAAHLLRRFGFFAYVAPVDTRSGGSLF